MCNVGQTPFQSYCTLTFCEAWQSTNGMSLNMETTGSHPTYAVHACSMELIKAQPKPITEGYSLRSSFNKLCT